MALIDWNKPKKVRDDDTFGFDGGPIGGYVPNMSDEDTKKWKGKIVAKTTATPQVEIRKTFSVKGSWNLAQVLIIVSLGKGYLYKSITREKSKGVNVHISTNGTIQMTFAEMEEMNEVIKEAKIVLEELVK